MSYLKMVCKCEANTQRIVWSICCSAPSTALLQIANKYLDNRENVCGACNKSITDWRCSECDGGVKLLK